MASDSPKQRQELLKQIRKKLERRLSFKPASELEKINKLPEKELIPSAVASAQIKEIGEHKLVIRFDHFDMRKCDFTGLDIPKMQALLRKFKYITDLEERYFSTSDIERDTIQNGQAYAFLFVGLPQDFKICETELPNGGRIFYSKVEEFIQVIAVRTKHLDT